MEGKQTAATAAEISNDEDAALALIVVGLSNVLKEATLHTLSKAGYSWLQLSSHEDIPNKNACLALCLQPVA